METAPKTGVVVHFRPFLTTGDQQREQGTGAFTRQGSTSIGLGANESVFKSQTCKWPAQCDGVPLRAHGRGKDHLSAIHQEKELIRLSGCAGSFTNVLNNRGVR